MSREALSENADGRRVHAGGRTFVAQMGVAEVDLPHVVLCRDARGTASSFSGPYPSAIEALVAADLERRSEVQSDGSDALTFHVMPLHPVMGPNPREQQ